MLLDLAESLQEIDCCNLKYKATTFLSLKKEVTVHPAKGKLYLNHLSLHKPQITMSP